MAPPVWSVGQVLSASDVNNWFVELAAYKTSATTRNTLVSTIDPDLQFTIPTGSSFWEIRAGIIYSGSAGSFLWTWTTPSGVGGGYTAAIPQGTPMPNGFVWSASPAGNTNGVTNGVQIQGMLSLAGSTGTFGLQWCSNSGPNSLTVGAGSYLIARRIG